MSQPEPNKSERLRYFQQSNRMVGGGTAFAFGLLVVLLTKDKISAADEQALWGLAVAIPGWVLLWFTLNDVERHWHGRTPRLIMQNLVMGMVPALLGTLHSLYSLLNRVSPGLIVIMFGLMFIAVGAMWKAMNLPVTADAQPTPPRSENSGEV